MFYDLDLFWWQVLQRSRTFLERFSEFVEYFMFLMMVIQALTTCLITFKSRMANGSH